MAQIEPDLLTKNIPLLDEKHKGETPEQHAQRTARYQKAMAEYDKRYAELMASLNRDVAQQKRTGIAAIEQKNAKKEASTLSGIESAILSSS
ncbi:hypothetical protein A3C37_01350 [Candidatus Peribacteria bacterium RIFCSPHIGHO2_02_FULL_53_20]|nr:MAG: hypothetical protein A3C37_01350 [Candidatus Peribacteria bacterium RIFCSPHIGHO2_02_FULL_53_20]OGJ67844.1 MAG: hypothetical protein A3B61_02600 [Candidatus Peribacteria bacterium RIFCSPLOWO2_01_FULL_53_10]OGJ70802.1 MAG: hypothetical protein A3G69_02615 [Candidatus Peribacteria bacterium RIFCSPLOWO2_12_FULL_53_10]